ncbi:YncE family protein [Bacillus carboniphilus]|uniref:YncE family protein n=1 Tax=Bacillus carboniphilus TaxID=86663 RepID=A0ABY9JT90_9BACI|nr:YncE family protein [Bacillus carboniphilus]WLR42606.1 YncE family protein [Bacillus carboniphilus]
MTISFSSGPINNASSLFNSVEVRIRNTDAISQANVTVRFFNESTSPETLISSNSILINALSTESVSFNPVGFSSFLIEIEVSLVNRSDVITATAVQPTASLFIGSTFVEYERFLVVNPKQLQTIEYPESPQLNLFVPDTINCKGVVTGDVTLDGVPQCGISVSLSSNTTDVSFSPNPAITDLSGSFTTNIIIDSSRPTATALIQASAQVGNQPIQTVAVTNLFCGFIIYTANSQIPFGNNISVVDGLTNTVIETVTAGLIPNGIATDPFTKRVYVSNSNSLDISVLDGNTNTIIDTISIGESPGYLTLSTNTTPTKLYAPLFGSEEVSIIDTNTNEIVTTLSIGSGPRIPSTNQQTNRVYIPNINDNNITIIDGDTNTLVGTITVGNSPFGVTVLETTSPPKLYVTNSSDNNVSVVDLNTNMIITTIEVGMNPQSVRANQTTEFVYVGNFDDDTLSIIDANSDTVISTSTLGFNPVFIDINEQTNELFISFIPNLLGVFDADINQLKDLIIVGQGVNSVAILMC